MPGNNYTHRVLLVVTLILFCCISAVSASTTTKEITQLPYNDYAKSQAFDYAEGSHSLTYFHHGGNWGGLELHLKQVQNFQNVHYVQSRLPFTTGTEGYHDVWYKRPSDGTFQRGVLQYVHIDGGTILNFWPANWEVGSKTGSYYTYIYGDNNGEPASQWLYYNQGDYLPSGNTHTAGNPDYGGYFGLNRYSSPISYSYHLEGYTNNAYSISVTDKMASLQVDLQREFPPDYHYSVISLYDSDDNVILTDSGSKDLNLLVGKNKLAKIRVLLGNDEYIYNLALGSEIPGDSDAIPVDIYVRNSQTGNLLAGSHIIISASVGGEFHEVVNQTLPGGTATYTLQPTGGGLPNPDYYRLIATADGYNPYMPYIDFELDRPTNLIVMMEPITGGPVDENKTFIEFYVRDLSGNGISDASVTCGGYALITNSAGYTQFEMPKNAIYPYSVSKSGYVTIEGTATVGDGPRYVVNVVLGPKEIPTYTPDPGETPGGPGATPTPDRRTNEEKGQAVIDMIADNAEGLGALALICLMLGLLKLMVKW